MRQGIVRLLLLLIVGSLAAPSMSSAFAAPGGSSIGELSSDITASQYRPDGEECEMLGRINSYRKANGLKALKLSRTLGAAAEHHSVEMAKYNYFSHTLRKGVTWSQNIINHGYPSNAYRAENLAAGSSGASNTFKQWRNSSGHNANMLSSTYVAIGIGRAYGADTRYGWYWTTTFGSVTSQTISC